MRRAIPVLVHVAIAIALTWPVAVDPSGWIVGAERSDAWNSIWSLWFVHGSVAEGVLPLQTHLLQHPTGGQLVVADPLNALLALPLVALWGPVVAYGLLCLGHSAFAGLAGRAFGRALGGSGWIAGLTMQLAPVFVSHLHNGSSEAISAGWLPLAGLALIRVVDRPGVGRAVLAGLALAVCAVSGWYAGVGAWCLLAGLVIWKRTPQLVLTAVVALALTAPWARTVRDVARAEDGLVQIKNDDDMARLRRTLGAADPRTLVTPGPFRSPDFNTIEGRPGDYVHTTYLGFSLVILALAATWRRREVGPWWVAFAIAVVLSLGPVVVMDGFPASWRGRAIPLPYLLLERLPGFDALTLLYRVSGAAVLALAAMAERLIRDPRWGATVGGVVALELALIGPTSGLPETTPVTPSPALEALAAEPAGAVVNLPVSGGRAYLYEQTVHGHPLAAALNTGANRAALEVLAAARRYGDGDGSLDEVRGVAQAEGVRFVVVHRDQLIGESFIRSVRVVRENFDLVAEDDRVRIYRLY